MSDRITNRDLDGLCGIINRTLGVEASAQWSREGDKIVQAPGYYHIDGAYGGVALYRTCDVNGDGESHGVHDVFRAGHMPKRDLYNRLRAFLDGIEARA